MVPRVPRATSAGPRHLVLRSHHFCGCSTFFNGNTFQADFEAKYLFVLGCTQKLQGMGSGDVVITKGARFCRVQGWKRSMYNDIFTLPQTLLTLLLRTSVAQVGVNSETASSSKAILNAILTLSRSPHTCGAREESPTIGLISEGSRSQKEFLIRKGSACGTDRNNVVFARETKRRVTVHLAHFQSPTRQFQGRWCAEGAVRAEQIVLC